jgi:hypothetical protein
MFRIFRISTINGLLLALYFIPAWTAAAIKIVVFPIRGLYDRANIGPAIFFSDHLQFVDVGTIRLAWLLAVAKLLVAAFFILFALLVVWGALRKSVDGNEALIVALTIGTVISFASMVLAAYVGETSAQHLHATETLMLIGGLVLAVVDVPRSVVAINGVATAHGA